MSKNGHLYTPRGQTRKPCPCCGSTELRPIDGVCNVCSSKVAEIDRMRDAERKRQEQEKLDLYFVPSRWNETPFYSIRARHIDKTRDELEDRTRRTLYYLVHLLKQDVNFAWSQAHPTDWDHAHEHKLFPRRLGLDGTEKALLPKEVATAITALDASFSDLLTMAYQAGLKDGRSLLMMLHEGEITMSDFEANLIPSYKN